MLSSIRPWAVLIAAVVLVAAASDAGGAVTPGSMAITPAPSPDNPPPGDVDPNRPEDLRRVLVAWAVANERAFPEVPRGASEHFRAASPETIEGLHALVPDPAAWIASLRAVTRALESANDRPFVMSIPTPTPADYPPSSGPHATFVASLISGGYLASTSVRCDGDDFTSAYSASFTAEWLMSGADMACTLGGCDPTGVSCAIACVIAETAHVVYEIATIPVRKCEFHDSTIADAELESIYANVLRSFDGLASLETQVDARSAGIEANDDANRDAEVANDNANRDAILANDDANRDAIVANDDANRGAIVTNDDANRDAIMANDDANRDAILAALAAQGADERARHVQALLGDGRCEPWMYLPESQPTGRSTEVVAVVQAAIDSARALRTTPELMLLQAESHLAAAEAILTGGAPLEAESACRHLTQAYLKATVHSR